MNKVYKIFYCGSNEIVFILQTEGDDDYWWWAVDKEDVVNRYRHWDINQSEANEFVNDEQNELLGISGAGFETIDDAIKDCVNFDMREWIGFKEIKSTKEELLDALSQAMCALEDCNNQGLNFLNDYASVDERLDELWSIVKGMNI